MGKVSMLAAFVAPPFAPALGFASLKLKTVRERRVSPERSDSPFAVRRRWKRLIAVGAVKRSRKRAAFFSASSVEAGGAGVAVGVGWVATTVVIVLAGWGRRGRRKRRGRR